VNVNGHWVHDWSPFLIRFQGDFGIRWYGLAYILGFVLFILFIRNYRKRGLFPVSDHLEGNLLPALILGVLLGGRLGYLIFYDLGDWLQDPLLIFKVWQGGMASHGGLIGVAIVLWWQSRKTESVSFLGLADMVSSVAPLALGLGRLANFINGELWGKVSDVSWAIIFPASGYPGQPLETIAPRHPYPLYAFFLEGLLPFLWLQVRLRFSGARWTPGKLGSEFLIFYSIGRLVGEHFREPDASLILGLSRGSFYSLFLLFAGATIWWILTVRAKNTRGNQDEQTH